MGRQDILLAGGKIIAIAPNLDLHPLNIEYKTIDASNFFVLPGFIDQHVHITGGGGEGGPVTRTPEISLSQLTTAGVTTVVGLLGIDSVSRNVFELLSKARALEQEGITSYIFTGAYEIPTRTITGKIRSDLVLVDKVIGTGEVAISDHRSAQPTLEDFIKLAAESRVGGLLGNKAGLVHVHVGEGKKGLSLLFEAIHNSDIPVTQLVPTHVNRLAGLFQEAVAFLKMGGNIDLTVGITPEHDSPQSLEVCDALRILTKEEADLTKVTVSSDGNGSLPVFNDHGSLTRLEVSSVKLLWHDVAKAVRLNIIPLPVAAALLTRNVARLLKLFPAKGIIAKGSDADLVFLNHELKIEKVIAKGNLVVDQAIALVKGYFEQDRNERSTH